MGSKGRYLKKCPKPCWPIKSKENLDWVHVANIINPKQARINHEKYTFYFIKSLEQLKNLITGRVLLFMLVMHVIRSQIYLVRQSLLISIF
jgi:hypothetical protein